MLTSVIQALHAERMVRTAAEEHIKSMAVSLDSANQKAKQLSNRYEELLEKLAAKDKKLMILKGDLGESQDEVRLLRDRVKELEEEVRTLEGNMTLADHRALATAQVVKHGVKFHGTIRAAEMVCKWNMLSKEVQACGNGRADDPHAIVPDIIETPPEELDAKPEKPKRKKKKLKEGATASRATAAPAAQSPRRIK